MKIKEFPLFIVALVTLLALAAAHILLPDRDMSEMEHAALDTLPVMDAADVLDGDYMRAMDDYIGDQLPLRDEWLSLQALTDTALLRPERNGVLFGANGRLFEPVNRVNMNLAAANLNVMREMSTLWGLRVTVMVLPQSAAVYASDVPALYPQADIRAAIQTLAGKAEGLCFVDVMDALIQASETRDVYYRTDHHWTADGAQVGLECLAAALRLSGGALQSRRLSVPGFLGSYYARSPSPLTAPDTLTFDIPDGVQLTVNGQKTDGLYDAAVMTQRDKYAALLYGNHARVSLTGGVGSGTALVVHDSFANAMLPGLLRYYERVEAVDPRYFSENMSDLVNEIDACDVICVYGLDTLMSDRHLSLLTLK